MADSKTARASMVRAPKDEKPKLSNAEMIEEIRKLRAGKLAVLNVEYIDALLQEYGNCQTSNALLNGQLGRLQQARDEANTNAANWQRIAEERSAKIKADFETIQHLDGVVADQARQLREYASTPAPEPADVNRELNTRIQVNEFEQQKQAAIESQEPVKSKTRTRKPKAAEQVTDAQ